MVVYPERCARISIAYMASSFPNGAAELAKRGVSREQAYEWVQRGAMRALAEKIDFKSLLMADS